MSIFAAPSFYNQADQNIFNQGNRFITQEEYDFSNQKQINRTLTSIVEQLNSTYLNQQKEEQERFTWFIGG